MLTPGQEFIEVGEHLQRQDAQSDGHREIRYPQPRPPHRTRAPAIGPGLVPENRREPGENQRETERDELREDGEAEPRTRPHMSRRLARSWLRTSPGISVALNAPTLPLA